MASARSTLVTVMLVSFLATAGVALPFPMLAPYFLAGDGDPQLVAFLGIHPKLLLGALLAVYPLGILLGSSFLGALSDHFGRKRVLVVTLCLGGVGYAATAAAVAAGSFPFFLLARFLTGVCEGNDAVARTIALDLHPQISRSQAIAMVFAATYAGWLTGPLIGGYLMFLGMGTVFLLAGAALLFCAVVAYFTLLDTAQPRSKATALSLWRTANTHNSLHLWRDAPIRQMLIFHLLYTFGLNACYEFYPVWLVEYFGSGPQEIAWLTVFMTAAMILNSAFVVTRLRSRFGSVALLNVGTASFAVLLGLLVLTPLPLVPLAFAALGAIISLNNTSFPEYMIERFTEEGSGRVMGLISTNFYVANVGVAVFGSVLALAGSRWSLLAGSVLCTIAWLWLRRAVREPVAVRPGAQAS